MNDKHVLEVLKTHIDAAYEKTAKNIKNSGHSERITKFHDNLDLIKTGVEVARRGFVLYAADVQLDFYNKGFLDGLGVLREAIENQLKNHDSKGGDSDG